MSDAGFALEHSVSVRRHDCRHRDRDVPVRARTSIPKLPGGLPRPGSCARFEPPASGPWERNVVTDVYWLAPEWLELLGYAPGDLQATAQGLGSIMHPDDVPAQRAAVRACIEQGKPYDVEFRARTKGGDYPWLHSRGLPEFDAQGRVVRISGALENVTARHQYEEALVEARKVAADASRAKGDFLAHMSHEIRTPMNGVLGMSEAPARNAARCRSTRLGRRPSGQRQCTAALRQRCARPVEDRSRKTRARRETARAAQGATMWRDCCPSRRSRKRWTHGARRSGAAGTGFGDELRIRQILLNLTGNAIKFTDRGGVAIAIRCTESDQSRVSIRCEVRDTGPGMSPDQQAKLFRNTQRWDEDRQRKAGGTGLGLSIVRRLATLMDGEAGVVSSEGAGSTFWFTAAFARAERMKRVARRRRRIRWRCITRVACMPGARRG